jgi:hypothetical protein
MWAQEGAAVPTNSATRFRPLRLFEIDFIVLVCGRSFDCAWLPARVRWPRLARVSDAAKHCSLGRNSPLEASIVSGP